MLLTKNNTAVTPTIYIILKISNLLFNMFLNTVACLHLFFSDPRILLDFTNHGQGIFCIHIQKIEFQAKYTNIMSYWIIGMIYITL